MVGSFPDLSSATVLFLDRSSRSRAESVAGAPAAAPSHFVNARPMGGQSDTVVARRNLATLQLGLLAATSLSAKSFCCFSSFDANA
jgi:hypothetical protein